MLREEAPSPCECRIAATVAMTATAIAAAHSVRVVNTRIARTLAGASEPEGHRRGGSARRPAAVPPEFLRKRACGAPPDAIQDDTGLAPLRRRFGSQRPSSHLSAWRAPPHATTGQTPLRYPPPNPYRRRDRP